MMHRVASVVAWAGIAALCAIGVAGGLQRAAAVVGDPAALERREVEDMASWFQLEPGSPKYVQLEQVVRDISAKFADLPAATLAHVVPGAFILLFAPLQFSRALRTRRPALHRWSGRALLVLVAVSGVAGIVLGLDRPMGGVLETTAAVTFGSFFLFAAARGYAAIRRRDLRCHREWMSRMFAAALAISVIRVMTVAGLVIVGMPMMSPGALGLMLWAGWILTLLANELWLRRTARASAAESAPALQPL